ncbi:MAG: putative baseplate assembly protein, partial [Acidobacteria bacterium]
PGITFIELFAWLAEIQNYRLNQVTDKNYQQFFKLIGLSPRPTIPARMDIAFTLEKGDDQGPLIPAGTKIVPAGKEDFVFETSADFFLTRTALESVKSYQNGRIVDHTEANKTGNIYYTPFNEDSPEGSFLLLKFKSWFKEPEFNLSFYLFEDDLPSAGAPGDEGANVTRSALLTWEYQDQGKWQPIDIKEDATEQLTRSGKIIFRTPAQPQAGKFLLRGRLEGRYEIPPRLVSIETNVVSASQIETVINEDLKEGLGIPWQQVRLKKAPLLTGNHPGASTELKVGDVLEWKAFIARITADERDPVVNDIWSKLDSETRDSVERLASEKPPNDRGAEDREWTNIIAGLNRLLESNDLKESGEKATAQCRGEASRDATRKENRAWLQRAFPGLLAGDELVIQTGKYPDWETWKAVETFDESGPKDKHYLLDAKEGVVTFGNGLNGRVPQKSEDIRARSYRYSKGAQGNLPAGQTWSIQYQPASLLRGHNKRGGRGGQDAETIEEAIGRAENFLQEKFRAITDQDYSTLALQTPGLRVARAEVIAGYHPDFPNLKIPGNVTVVVVPHRRPIDPSEPRPEAPPQPGKGFIQTVKRHLDSHRLVATQVHVSGPKYVKVSVKCTVHLNKRASSQVVTQNISQALTNFLDPIHGGADGQRGWPLGRDIFPSEIYQLIDKQEGVDYVIGVSLNGQKVDTKLELPPTGLPYSGEHKIMTVPSGETDMRAEEEPGQPEYECPGGQDAGGPGGRDYTQEGCRK